MADTSVAEITPTIGQRLTWTFDLAKGFKHKQEDGTEVDLLRVYQIVLPYGAPFDETYTVLAEITAEIQKIEKVAKENAEKQAAKEKSQEVESTIDVEAN